MTISQTIFDEDGKTRPNPRNLSVDDMKIYARWKQVIVDCPTCLLRAPLSKFVTFHKLLKKGHRQLSKSMARCPRCYKAARIKTIIKVTNMTAREFGLWYWENVFKWGTWKSVGEETRNLFFETVKKWSYEDRQDFWEIYHKFKGGMNSTSIELEREQEDFEDYMKSQKA